MPTITISKATPTLLDQTLLGQDDFRIVKIDGAARIMSATDPNKDYRVGDVVTLALVETWQVDPKNVIVSI